MRLLIVATLYPPYIIGGAEISTQLLVESLMKQGHEVLVVTTTNKPSFTTIINNVNVCFIKHKNIYWKFPSRDKGRFAKFLYHTIDIFNFLYEREIVKIVRDFKPDVIHSQNLCGISTYIWEIAKRLKIPLVHTLRDYYLMCPKQSMSKNGVSCETQCKICKLYSIPKRKLSENVNAVVGISNFILDKHTTNGFFQNASLSVCISNSVQKVGAKNRKKNKIIGYIGRISEEKGVELLMEAFTKANNSGYQLEIAGKGNKSYIQYLVGKYHDKNIKFLGHVVADSFYERVDLLVVPSIWNEPFGRVVIEAYSHGVPVFASNMGGLPELINEFTGRTFSVNKKSELTSLLSDFINDKIVFDQKKIKSVADCKYTEEAIALQYEAIYFNLLKSKRNEDCSNS
jgi:glycosyltransferase involved in cell wall biosynthesis